MEKDLDLKLYYEYLEGNKEAFNYLYNKYKDKIQFFIYNIVKDHQISEDITQEVFMYMLKDNFKGDCSFKTYLYIIARSKAISFASRKISKDQKDELYFERNHNVDAEDIADIVIRDEVKKEILESINKLPDKYKNAIYLTQIEELSYKETAKILDETPQNIKTLVHRGKKELKKVLIKKGYNEMNKVLKVFVMLIVLTSVLTGVTLAGVYIYNEFIKAKDDIDSRGLFDLGDGHTYYEIDLMANDMTWNDDARLYHRIITNKDDYNKYKERIDEFPDVNEIDFDKEFVVVIANENLRQAHESDMEIFNVVVDENITTIIMKQKENPKLNSESNVWYAVVDKSMLKDDVKVVIESNDLNVSKDFMPFNQIPDFFDSDDAIDEGYIVEVNGKLLSNNLKELDEFIRRTENKESGTIRIFKEISDDYNIHRRIYEITYEKGIYYVKSFFIKEQRENQLQSFTKFEKVEKDNVIQYALRYDDGNTSLSSMTYTSNNYLPLIRIEK